MLASGCHGRTYLAGGDRDDHDAADAGGVAAGFDSGPSALMPPRSRDATRQTRASGGARSAASVCQRREEMDASLNDAHLAEAIARQGGYEEVELKSLWGAVAGALGKKKSHANMIKQRYEDMLRASVEQDEQDEEEAQDYEVDQILDKRTHQGQLEYLVKWKGADANEDDTSWEPRRNLAGCDEALHEFETRQPRSREREAREQPAAAAATAPAASAMSVSDAQPPEATGSAVAASHVAADGREYRRVTGVMRPQHGQLGHQGWIVELGEGQVRRTPAPQLPTVPCMVACHPPASRASRARAAGGARRQRHAEATGAAAAARLLREPAAIRIAETHRPRASGVQGRGEVHCGWPVPVRTDGMLKIWQKWLIRMIQRHPQSRHTPHGGSDNYQLCRATRKRS